MMSAPVMMFHPRTGEMVSLSNGNRTAQRMQPTQEYNNGLVLSLETLKDSQLFEVQIDKKINSWTGAIGIGVTTSDPLTMEFPSYVVDLRESWIMLGSSILKDGKPIVEDYGQNLDSLDEGNRVGVMKTAQGNLYFFINSHSLGLAASGLPANVRAVVDLYGKCCQITIMELGNETRLLTNEISNESVVSRASENVPVGENNCDNEIALCSNHSNTNGNRLRFHECTGSLVALANNGRTAERRRPLDEFNNGVVMTNRPLRNNELFEIRIDCLVDKWSGSIEVGVTTHSPATIQFPATMTNMRSGTIMMSGCGILTNGKGTRREYGEYNLDLLCEGDRIGLMRKSDGTLSYYINGIDQGVAATNVPSVVYGVIDLYGMTVKVTIVDRDDRVEQGLANDRNNTLIREYQLLNREFQLIAGSNGYEEKYDPDVTENLSFHRRCGRNVTVVNNNKTAQRPSPVENFDNAVVLTNRPLLANEIFEVQLDVIINKWMGSLEIGVTTHNPNELEFPSTMTNMKSGTWMMTGNGIMHNGVVTLEDYGQNLDFIRVGDRVSVIRKADGALHFYVNGCDQGLAAPDVPEGVFGAIDLFGQAAQATIVDHIVETVNSVSANEENSCRSQVDLGFHHLHGRNARISCNGRTASRPNAQSEFNDAIVISNRPLRDGEMFEVVLDKMVDRWSGSIEAGITAIKPEVLVFPSTMTDIDFDTWMLSGSSIMQDGLTIRNGYKCDLDLLTAGMRIGMMRCADASLHYYLNGEDMGPACNDIPSSVYAVIDLYGQCAQVTLVSQTALQSCLTDSATSPQTHTETLRTSVLECLEVAHCFSQLCGKNVSLLSNGMVAFRNRGFNHGILFSSLYLQPNELFEVQVQKVNPAWSGTLRIGVTTLKPTEVCSLMVLPTYSSILSNSGDTWLISGGKIFKNTHLLHDNYGMSLDWLDIGDRVGVKRCSDGTLHFFRNGEDAGVAASDLPKGVYVVIDLYGSVEKLSIVSKVALPPPSIPAHVETSRERRISIQSEHSRDSLERDLEDLNTQEPHIVQEFHDNHGCNIECSEDYTRARRIVGYNNGVVFSRKPLQRGQPFQVRIERLNSTWVSSIIIGVTAHAPDKNPNLVSAFSLRKPWWLICGDSVFHNGRKVKSKYSIICLEHLQTLHSLGVMIDNGSGLHLIINGVDQGVACLDIPPKCYAVLDLYGQCEEVKICLPGDLTEPDLQEKEDIVHKWEEKISRMPTLINNCDYHKACLRFKWMLGIPDGYFSNDISICFCDKCYKLHGEAAYQRKGDPPRDYSVPLGWCQFHLKLASREENSGITDKWHVAFHGAHPSIIRRILELNELVLPDDAGLFASTKRKSQKNKSKDADVEANQICFSPTIRYAANNILTPKFEFHDTKSKKKLHARTVFQVLVQPGSYNSGPQRIGAREPIDCHFSNNDIEWLTKEKGAILLHSLLIRIENF